MRFTPDGKGLATVISDGGRSDQGRAVSWTPAGLAPSVVYSSSLASLRTENPRTNEPTTLSRFLDLATGREIRLPAERGWRCSGVLPRRVQARRRPVGQARADRPGPAR